MRALFVGGWDGKPYGTRIIYTHYWRYLTANRVEVINGCIERSRFSYSAVKHFPFIVLEMGWRWPRLLLKNLGKDFDFALVCFPSFYDVPLAKLLCVLKRKPLVYNPMDSQYLALAKDRGLARKGSLKDKILWLYDLIPCRLADAITVHSEMHARQFVEMFGLNPRKLLVVPQGYLREKPAPRPRKFPGFVVGYVGSFIPHHGVEYVLRAAKILQDAEIQVSFKLMGGGQALGKMRALANELGLRNAEFLGAHEIPEMVDFAANDCDVLLGVFGTSVRTEINVPGKIWEALAFGKPLVTVESAGTRFIGLQHQKHAWLVRQADEAGIAEAVRTLLEDTVLRRGLGEQALCLFKENYTVNRLGALFLAQLRERGLIA